LGEKLMSFKQITGWVLVAAGLVVLTLKLSHRYDPAPAVDRLSGKAGPKVAAAVKRIHADSVVYAVMVVLPLCAGAFLLLSAPAKADGEEPEEKEPEPAPAPVAARVAKSRAPRTPVSSCNVLHVSGDARNVWQFDARNGGFVLNREQITLPGEPLPSSLVGKSWRSLWQRKLNVAWLPSENVFLRVAQFPQSEFTETVAMVELQMEKLSPLPVAQIVWSIHVLPHASGNMQTVIVVVVSRDIVEEFLGKLEGQGFLADALELPLLDQLQATPISEDGVWIYPGALGSKNVGLAAWWSAGVLQNLDLLTLPATERAEGVKEQLMQMAWAGELDGWLAAPPRWHLVASGPVAAEWGPPLREGLDQPVEMVEPLPPAQLAAATAQRSALAPPNTSLLPPEFSTRYRQQFVDRLWMRSLGAVFALYLVGVAIYAIALAVATYRTSAVESQVTGLGPSYTNVLQAEAKLQILQDRQELKFAGLDCWRKVADLLPTGATLDGMNFADGKRLSLNGSASSDQIQPLLDFEAAMRRATDSKGQPMFDWEKGENLTYHTVPNGVTWSFSMELKRSELQ
jgi:hypothetical protein